MGCGASNHVVESEFSSPALEKDLSFAQLGGFMLYEEVRREVLHTTLRLYEQDLIHLTSGNISLRASSEHVAITPSGIAYETMQPEDIVIIDLRGNVVDGHYKPSSETPMHTLILRERPDVNAVIHTHSTYALTFAVLGRGIPLFCLEGLAIRGPVPVAEYACPSTEAIGRAALKALEGPPPVTGVLLRNHGALAIGADLKQAFGIAYRIETVARIYHLVLQIGEPIALTEEQIAEIYSVYKGEKAR